MASAPQHPPGPTLGPTRPNRATAPHGASAVLRGALGTAQGTSGHPCRYAD